VKIKSSRLSEMARRGKPCLVQEQIRIKRKKVARLIPMVTSGLDR